MTEKFSANFSHHFRFQAPSKCSSEPPEPLKDVEDTFAPRCTLTKDERKPWHRVAVGMVLLGILEGCTHLFLLDPLALLFEKCETTRLFRSS